MDPISYALQVVASVVTLWAIWQTGNKSVLGPLLSLISDFAFVTLNIYQHLWALVPFCGVLLVLHIRNIIKWRAEALTLRRRDALQQSKAETSRSVSEHHRKRRAAKAYEIIAGGELR